MATDLERLLIRLEANTTSLDKGMKKASSDLDRRLARMERQVAKSGVNIGSIMAKAGARVNAGLAGIAAGASLQGFQNVADAAIRTKNALVVAGLEGEELTRVYDALYGAAQRQGVPLEALAKLYGKVAGSQKELNATGPELLQFVEGIATGLRVQGTSATEAAGALTQLGQALGGGRVEAEEFGSLIDGMPSVLRAASLGLKEAGGSVQKLRQLVNDGKISSEAFFRAFLAGLPELQRQAASTSQTTEQGFTNIGNALQRLVGAFNDASGASGGFLGALNDFATDIDNLNTELQDAANFIRDLFSLAEKPLVLKVTPGAPADPKLPTFARLDTPPITPVTLSSFKPPPGKEKGGGGSKKSEAEKDADAYKNLTDATRRRIEDLKLEQDTLGMAAGAAARFRTEQELLNEAERDGIPLTAARRAEIAALAADMGSATTATDAAREAQERLDDALQEARSTFVDVGGGLRDAFKDGRLEASEMLDIVGRLVDRLQDKALEGLADSLFGKSGAASSGGSLGLIGEFFKSFAGGKADGGTVGAGKWALVGERGPELIGRASYARTVIPDVSRLVPMTAPRLMSARSGPSGPSTVKIAVDVSGARGDREIEARVLAAAEAGTRAAIAQNNTMRDRTLRARWQERDIRRPI